nr:hypothetical protein [Tanacetum cinerariifolium]
MFTIGGLTWAHSKKLHSTKATTEFKILQGQDVVDEAQEIRVVLDEEQLLFIAADQCDAFDSEVDETPTAQTMFMANLSSADPIYDEADPSYDSDILSEVQDHDNYIDNVGEYHDVHEMQNDVQPNYIVDSDVEYTSDSNIIPYEQYVKDNPVAVIQTNVSYVHNDALMMIINYMHKLTAQCVFANEQSKVVNASLTAKLARYKEQLELFERRARFELNDREQNIDEQLRIIITDRNIKEETFKKELHSVKMQLNSTINHNKSMTLTNLVKGGLPILDSQKGKEVSHKQRNVTLLRFSEMHNAYTVVQARCLELEAEISKLKHKIKKDDHSEMIKHFSNLEETHSKADHALDFRALDFQITELTEKVTVLQEQNALFMAENATIKQHYKELYDSIKITCAKTIEKTTALLAENENLKA